MKVWDNIGMEFKVEDSDADSEIREKKREGEDREDYRTENEQEEREAADIDGERESWEDRHGEAFDAALSEQNEGAAPIIDIVEVLYAYLAMVRHKHSTDETRQVVEGFKDILDRYEAQEDDAALLGAASAARDEPMERDSFDSISEDARALFVGTMDVEGLEPLMLIRRLAKLLTETKSKASLLPAPSAHHNGGCGEWFDIDPYVLPTGIYEAEDGARYQCTLETWKHLWPYLEAIGSTRLRRVTTVIKDG